jgi:CMP-N,N'-diacetyllegionaminic acid synthase
MHKRTCVIIPARGGSKRLPKKNIIDFAGRPMITWTISAAQKALNADIYVSTDYEDIAEISRMAGARVIYRKTGSDDQTTVQEATIITLKQIEDEIGVTYDTVIQLMACCPLRDEYDIRTAFCAFSSAGYDFQLSCVEDRLAFWNFKLDASGIPRAIYPEALKMRSQDLPTQLRPTGAIWIANVEALLAQGTFYGKDVQLFPLSRRSSIDIDTMDDLILAKALKEML